MVIVFIFFYFQCIKESFRYSLHLKKVHDLGGKYLISTSFYFKYCAYIITAAGILMEIYLQFNFELWPGWNDVTAAVNGKFILLLNVDIQL